MELDTRAGRRGTARSYPEPDHPSRRCFIGQIARFASGLLVLPTIAACNGSSLNPAASAVIDTRSDEGIMNALYAMKQLSGDFFTRVTRFRYPGMLQTELATFSAILSADSEAAVWFVDSVRAGRIYDFLEFDFAEMDFDNRAVVIGVATELKGSMAAAFEWGSAAMGRADWAAGLDAIAQSEAEQYENVVALAGGSGNPISPTPAADVLRGLTPFFKTRLTIRG